MKKKKILISFFALIILISSGFILYTIFHEDENELFDTVPSEIIVDNDEKIETVIEKEKITMAPDVDLASERAKYKNNDIIGRLEINDLFNVLVVQGNDNKYYLNYSIKKEKDIRGSEFMDYRVSPTSKQINIYGHNTRDEKIKVPFLRLENFLKEDFFNTHPYIIFQHDTGKNVYKIMSIKEITTDYEHMEVNKVGEEFVKHLDNLKKNSIFTRDVEYDEESEIIVLQTCSHHLANAYYIITAVKIDA